ncbi:serine/threonine-protein phosphatase 2A regulatory subunit B'' subunit beta [Strongylocentrotus purpuratus]|uniref:EF-hand domain-containing protein n=1 Tax=Strongylocentrotus purpuratus TaxID=7668 RepID=A0A7M7NM97_STRPU|nr:serine/threonine-protein phosphatase 2A regulatory subunit B'' subunit beta [Strongylocentrotus purpuratus]
MVLRFQTSVATMSSLRPVLKLKVDELFLRWLSESDTQKALREDLKMVVRGDVIFSPPTSTGFPFKNHGGSPASPLLRSSSPSSTPPCSPPPTLSVSPRSPRKRSSSSRLSRSLSSSSASQLFQEQREANKRQKSQQIVNVPQFYFPFGKPVASEENEAVLKRLTEVFKALPDQKASKEDMDKITQACRCPKFWRVPLYNAAGGETSECVSAQAFMAMWRRITKQCHDDASRFFRLLSRPGAKDLTPEDFNPLVQDIVNSHPGLVFLQDAPEFHSRYITTVVSRIFYTINRSWKGRITLPELRRSNFLSVIALLEEEDDINQIMDYFSYEHFYVIYCKFWELDMDHDLYIDKKDLARHQDHAISSRMIDRIFSPGTVLSPASVREGRMSYNEFVWFLLSEEDKKQPISIEYWFRCMDLDGDGLLSMFELEFFYEEQLNKMESLGIETLPFEDCLCQLLDLVKPKNPDYITLHDLKNCKLAYIFFDTLFNLEKFLEHEQRDPFASNRDYDSESPEPTDWEKYAADEYEMLVAEEGGQDTQQHSQQGDDCDYSDDFEPDEDIITIDLRQKATISEPGAEPQRNQWIGEGGDDS